MYKNTYIILKKLYTFIHTNTPKNLALKSLRLIDVNFK